MMSLCKRKGNAWVTAVFLMWSYASGLDVNVHCPRCPSPPLSCNSLVQISDQDNCIAYLDINGTPLEMLIMDNTYIAISCNSSSLALDNPSFPKFNHTMQFRTIIIKKCSLVQKSFAQTLNELNISGFDNLTIEVDMQEPITALTDQNFVGLVNLKALTLSFKNFYLSQHLDFSILEPMENLTHIGLNNMVITPFPPENRFQSVNISDGKPLETQQSWGGCEKLEYLRIIKWKVMKLPSGWLASCSRLISLHLEHFRSIIDLPEKMINSSNLIYLTITNCTLRYLPVDLLDNAKSLRILDLSQNLLMSLEGNMFSSIPLLETLVLTQNMLTVSSIEKLAPLVHLKSLNLDDNFNGDTCKWKDNRPLNKKLNKSDPHNFLADFSNTWPNLPSLERLSLARTKATVLCDEWSSALPSLKYLSLRETSIKVLRYDDIQLIRANGWDVDLNGNMFKTIKYDESDYRVALEDSQLNNATLRISKDPIDCDCRWYRFARVVQQRSGYVALPDLRCNLQWGKSADSMWLEQMRPEDFLCEIDSEPGCRGYLRIHDNTSQVNCTNAGLDHFPQITHLREVHLANNRIEKIHIRDLPETLEYLDLQYNGMSTLDEDTALFMFKRPTIQYYLKGNPISCLCINSPWINVLQMHHAQVKDYEQIICTHGVHIKDINTNLLCLQEYVPLIGGSFACIGVLFAIITILYYRYKKEIQIILYSRGWCAFCVNEEELDKDMIYDVFVSFAYEDSAVVMEELIPGLEKEPHAFSVCVHYRDWIAGEWIPNQIASSVEESRRTVIILSKNFLSSMWSLLEFRTAHIQALKDGRVRLIIILLEDVINDERIDGELRSYLATNTYIRWGDPNFWDKLLYALPHHRTDGKQKRPAGDEVLKLVKPNDPPIIFRQGIPLEMVSNMAYNNNNKEV